MSAERDVLGAARLAVECTARLLPTSADRRRYQDEFVAELYGLSPADQARYVAGLLSQILALRAALGTSSRPREIPMSTSTRPSLRCRVLGMHRWTARGAPHHAHVRTCTRCGREQGPFHTPGEQPTRNFLTGI
jgi:hypothetical protein